MKVAAKPTAAVDSVAPIIPVDLAVAVRKLELIPSI
jgi:hypothetical protein